MSCNDTNKPSPCGCVTAESIIGRVSRLLNDTPVNDTRRWPVATLIDFMNEGLGHIQSLRPDAFTEEVLIEVTDATPNKLPCEYDSLVSVNKHVVKSADGSVKVIGSIVEYDQEFGKYIANVCSGKNGDGTDCSTSGDAKPIVSYAKDAKTPGSFYVSPPLQRGQSAYVLATVVVKAPCYCADILSQCMVIDTKYHAALVDWIMYRALSIDMESEFGYRASARYESSFYRFLSAGYTQESKFVSGYYKGEKGDGDENVVAHAGAIR